MTHSFPTRSSSDLKIPPASIIIALKGRSFHGKGRGADDSAAFEHEGQSVVDLMRSQLRRHRGFGRAPVRPMRAHAIVQGSPTGRKPFGLRVVRAVNEAHETAHSIAVEPGWAKRVLSHQQARGQDAKNTIRDSRNNARNGQHRDYPRLRMVETDSHNGFHMAEINI